ncbi:MAG: hypothetical protein M1831_006047 [Alyxoria varia]|nr:MAG: hypothetical protein M1831_006047 [Alyxoria varia]
MSKSYLPIVIQSIAHAIGHQPGSTAKCARSRSAECLVRFGSGDIDYNSYVLYLSAISRACEGVLTIALSGFADVANFRKVMMVTCIVMFGLIGTPWAGLTERSYSFLTGASILYAAMNAFQGAYQALEFSYIPLFMKAHALDAEHRSGAIEPIKDSEEESHGSKVSLIKGSSVCVLGLVVSNVGAILGLLIGVVITYATHASVTYGYNK